MKNKPLSRYKVKKIIRCFLLELTATQTAKLLEINRNTVNRYYKQFRLLIVAHQQKCFEQSVGSVELDESYFGGRHKGAVGRSVKTKVPVFGILKRGGSVYTQIIPEASARTLKTIIRERVTSGSVVYTDSWKSYDGLIIGGFEHHRINHQWKLVDGKTRHINGIESFWSYVKNKLVKFYGIRRQDFELYLKEYEFRCNNCDKDISKLIEQMMK